MRCAWQNGSWAAFQSQRKELLSCHFPVGSENALSSNGTR
jgi:hypothetical protein